MNTHEHPSVLVLMGGPDAEREVSIVSGCAVANALRECGEFVVHERLIDRVTLAELESMPGDVIFPVLHGPWGEGGPLQTLLEKLGKPYIGCRPAAAQLAMRKTESKECLAAMGIATPEWQVLGPGEPCLLEPPIVLKPKADGSSVDLRICRTLTEIDAARAALHPRRGELLAERYIAGRELTVGILLDEALPIIEIKPAAEFYDYEAKYHREDTQYVLDPPLPTGLAARCKAIALTAFTELGCRDIARADFMLDVHGLWFLELNTMPGFTPHSLVPMAARHIGRDMAAICSRLVHAALERVAKLIAV